MVGQGYPSTPGLHSAEQVASWREVTDSVHAAGGRIFAQIMHAGRIGHPVLLPDGLIPVAPSPVAAPGQVHTHVGPKDFVEPHELTDEEIRATIGDFATASRNAIDAGFDGVELHGANGYLIQQFLAPNTNLRTDAWGGSDTARIRFAVEVVKAVVSEIGAERTAIRISPGNPYNGIEEPEPGAVYTALVGELEPLGLAYLHVLEQADGRELTLALRKQFTGTLVINVFSEGPTGPEHHTVIDDGIADIISYGALFLANPDLPACLKAAWPLQHPGPEDLLRRRRRGLHRLPGAGRRLTRTRPRGPDPEA